MKTVIISFLFIILLFSCSSRPKNFLYPYTGDYTGLDNLININGYYISSNCDSSYYDMIMFYNNGLLIDSSVILDLNNIDHLIEGFSGYKRTFSDWGNYIIQNDTIIVQKNINHGIYGHYTESSEFEILPEKKIRLISKYLKSDNWNYNWDLTPDCNEASVFYPLEIKADSTKCPLLKKKWFYEKK